MGVILTAAASRPLTWYFAPPSGLEPLTLRVKMTLTREGLWLLVLLV